MAKKTPERGLTRQVQEALSHYSGSFAAGTQLTVQLEPFSKLTKDYFGTEVVKAIVFVDEGGGKISSEKIGNAFDGLFSAPEILRELLPEVTVKRAMTAIEEPRGDASSILKRYRSHLKSAPLDERVKLEREGVPSSVVRELIAELGLPAADVQRFLGIPKATFTSKIKSNSPFAGAAGQSFVGLMDLANKADEIVSAEPTDSEAARGFNAERWLGEWIQRPQPALDWLAPAQVIDTPSGRESVMRLLGAIQSGAYL